MDGIESKINQNYIKPEFLKRISVLSKAAQNISWLNHAFDLKNYLKNLKNFLIFTLNFCHLSIQLI
ncbi:hypothetical protein HMPREF0204_14435 [Chryseobacterium gleum ATCC 35910]|uniref:Uncharacterized protein n=1 Tax=Chryseobacterium gleum ATCC 35910 TaxID=525257 RepID=A0ABP2IP67_CHRGE|nr:hypothetical protein HMPREF0204_14435 [Chryseobacterium gleum ATCC 35910]